MVAETEFERQHQPTIRGVIKVQEAQKVMTADEVGTGRWDGHKELRRK